MKCRLRQSKTLMHFSQTSVPNKVKCNACKHVFSLNNLSQLKKHLLNKHPGVLLENQETTDLLMADSKTYGKYSVNINK